MLGHHMAPIHACSPLRGVFRTRRGVENEREGEENVCGLPLSQTEAQEELVSKAPREAGGLLRHGCSLHP